MKLNPALGCNACEFEDRSHGVRNTTCADLFGFGTFTPRAPALKRAFAQPENLCGFVFAQ
ncbi:hypothetical protein ACVW0I_008061 [Bradyrhizobium sp. LM6.11]